MTKVQHSLQDSLLALQEQREYILKTLADVEAGIGDVERSVDTPGIRFEDAVVRLWALRNDEQSLLMKLGTITDLILDLQEAR